MASKIPARIDLTVEGEQFAPGATVSFNVTVTAQDRLGRSDVIAELVAVEEVDPYPTGDEDYEDEYEAEEGDEEGDEGNLVNMSFNGGDGEEGDLAEGDDLDDEEDWVQSTTYSEELMLAEGMALKGGESRAFSGSFVIPDDAQPSYDGPNATHSWWIDIYLEGDIDINESKEIHVR